MAINLRVVNCAFKIELPLIKLQLPRVNARIMMAQKYGGGKTMLDLYLLSGRRRSKASITNAVDNNLYTPRYVSARQRRAASSSGPTSATGTLQSHSCHGDAVALRSPSAAASTPTSRTRFTELSASVDFDITETDCAERTDEVCNNGGAVDSAGKTQVD